MGQERRNVVSYPEQRVLITGGAGYIGSVLTGVLLNRGYHVTVFDALLFGGESLLGYWHHPNFRFIRGDVCDPATFNGRTCQRVNAVVHLAAIVGFPACQAVGPQVARLYNVEGTKRVYEAAAAAGVERFIFASTYSNYGLSKDGQPVTEDSPLYPQSLYAETKIAAEEYLLNVAGFMLHADQPDVQCSNVPASVIFRFATLFGISPRTRFDLIINQFVLEALTKRKLVIYQRGYARSFVHVRDVCEAICLALEAPLEKVRGQVFNVGSDAGNYTKDEIVELVRRHVDGIEVEYKDLTFGGDMRDIRVSFAKIRSALGYEPKIGVEKGICEVRDAITSGLIKKPLDGRYRNAQFIVQ
ncbi:MAG TPA: NAD(P)-dependent oxidoreductase [Anaerolineae bacterium]|nr:NAD(P)-dependent oxidoreductase [Anaerolineae bacterium]